MYFNWIMYSYLANVWEGDLDAELEEEHIERKGACAVDHDCPDDVEFVGGGEQKQSKRDIEHHCYPTNEK